MNILVFGATGMVGQGVLRECLLDPNVQLVQAIGRSATGIQHPKLTGIVHADVWNYEAIQQKLTGFDACFFCLGVSSGGMAPDAYEHVTYDLTLAAAQTLVRLNPRMTFIYVSGASTDSTEQGRTRWARVKGKTENALLRLPFQAAYMFRPGFIEALHGARSKTPAYRIIYVFIKPLLPLIRLLFGKYIVTTEQIGRAMLNVAKKGYPASILEIPDIRAAAA